MIIYPLNIDWENATENLLTTGTISGMSGTFSGLTPTHVVYAGTAGLLSGSENLTFDGTNLTCAGTGQFSNIGVGAAPLSYYGIYDVISSTNSTVLGMFGSSSYTGLVTTTTIAGLSYSANYAPASIMSGLGKTVSFLLGGAVSINATTQANETKNVTITTASVYYCQQCSFTRGAGSSGSMTVTAFSNFRAVNPTLNNSAEITTLYGFYDPGLTSGTTNWGLAINTQSYFNANVRIGSAVAPTVALDVTGAALISTTLGVTGLSTLTGGISSGNIEPVVDDTHYLGKNDDDTPKAWKGLILKDQTDGKYYRIELNSGAISIVDLTD